MNLCINKTISIVLISTFAITTFADPQAEKKDEVKEAVTAKDIVRSFGAPFTIKDATSFDKIAQNAEKFANQTVLIEATVSGVCKVKGCWMTIKGSDSQSSARVTFKDYGFFVPKDCAGQKVEVEGKVQVKQMSMDERKHLAEDGKVPVSQVPAIELRIVANGVELQG